MEKTILVVDDEFVINNLITSQLNRLGYKAIQVFTGELAIDLYRSSHDLIDGILLDMKIPDISGLECIDYFKQINKDIKIIICSGMVYDYKSIAVQFAIQKPFTLTELKAACETYF